MRLAAFLAALAAGCSPLAASAQSAPSCHFELGFKTLHDLLPTVVGACLEDENHNPANGDGLQHTTGGLLVWRKLDNWTAFTDGYHTWINGPDGLQERLNADRFPWETLNLTGRAASDLPGTPIGLGTVLTSIVDTATKRYDVYAVNLDAGQTVHAVLTVDAAITNAALVVFDPGEKQLYYADSRVPGGRALNMGADFIGPYYNGGAGTCAEGSLTCSFTFNAATSGTYCVVVDANGDKGMKYTLHVY